METRWWERWGPLAGVLAVALFIAAFGIGGSSPDTSDSNEKIVRYLSSHSDQQRQIVGFLVFLAGVLFLLAFLGALRSRLVAAEGGLGRLGQFAFGAGVASAALWIGSVALFTSPSFTANDTHLFRSADIYRVTQDAGYQFWVAAVVLGALVVWAASAVALRTGILPKWFAWVGMVVGLICLFAIFFLPAFVYWGWIALASILFLWRERRRPSAAAT